MGDYRLLCDYDMPTPESSTISIPKSFRIPQPELRIQNV